MSQHQMNVQQGPPPQGLFPPFQPPLVKYDPVSTLIVRIGRPNCGWLRRMLFEQKALGRIQSYEESTGWLWRSFSIAGKKSALDAIWAYLCKIMPDPIQ